jgi:high mobility group protein B3
MTTATWNKLSNIVGTVLADSFGEDEASSAMQAWQTKKGEVTKLFTGSRQTRVKDPNAPKRPKTSYFLFCDDRRKIVQKANPEMKNTEIASELGRQWHALSDREKDKYVKLAEKEKKRYTEEMKRYQPSTPVSEPTKKTRARSKKEGPKRPMTSYLHFCQAVRETVKTENPDMKNTEITAELGRRWHLLSETERKPYVQAASKAKEAYQLAISGTADASSQTTTKEAPKEKVAKTVSKRQTAIKKTPGYEAFCSDRRTDLYESNPTWGVRKITSELNNIWRSLSEDERNAYEMEAVDEETESDFSDGELAEEED